MKDQSWLERISELKRKSVSDIMQSLNESFQNKTLRMISDRKYTDIISFPPGITREERRKHVSKELEVYHDRHNL